MLIEAVVPRTVNSPPGKLTIQNGKGGGGRFINKPKVFQGERIGGTLSKSHHKYLQRRLDASDETNRQQKKLRLAGL